MIENRKKTVRGLVCWLRCLLGHSWNYTAPQYYDEDLALEKVKATRTCLRCGKFEVRARHCLGLNPPEYHDEWSSRPNAESSNPTKEG
jgi:hypothetical protein